MKKILIIGGAGFIGYHLANKLTGRFKIDLIDNFSRGRKDKELTELVKKKNVKFFNERGIILEGDTGGMYHVKLDNNVI